jgi:hypothetical protein
MSEKGTLAKKLCPKRAPLSKIIMSEKGTLAKITSEKDQLTLAKKTRRGQLNKFSGRTYLAPNTTLIADTL